MAELDELIAFTVERYTAKGGKKKSVLKKIANCKNIRDLLKIRSKLGMMNWENKGKETK
jgi:hypothetical protein